MQSSLFSRFFPTPRLLSMEGGGIEIAERAIKYLRIARHPFGRRVAVYGEEPLPAGTISGGEIKNEGALVEALRAVRARCGFTFVHVSLPEQRGYIFDLTVSPAGQLRDSILLALPEHVPLSPAEAIFDCETVLSESTAESLCTVVTVFPESIALAYASALAAARFLPLSFELEPQASARAVTARMEEVQHGAHLFIDAGVHKTIFCIVQNGVVRFTTSIAGSFDYDEMLQKNTGTTDADALKKIKMEEGMIAKGENGALFSKLASDIATETKRLCTYWNTKAEGGKYEKISSIILYGGNANIHKLTETISHAVGLPAALADFRPALTGVSGSIPPIPKDESLTYATAIGLALRVGGTALW